MLNKGKFCISKAICDNNKDQGLYFFVFYFLRIPSEGVSLEQLK